MIFPDMNNKKEMNIENEILGLYCTKHPDNVRIIDSSHGDDDIRRTYIADNGMKKLVIHETMNAFTDENRIAAWARLQVEYNRLSIYCPLIVPNLRGELSHIFTLNGRIHYVYAEEFSPYDTVETIGYDKFKEESGTLSYLDDMLRSVGVVASAHFDFCDFGSAYCLLEPFCPPDTTDEATMCMQKFCEYVKNELPEHYPRVEQLRKRFFECQEAVRRVYPMLPVSCFQSDLNCTNILIENDRFKGVIDFNLSGREPVLNYVTRLAMNYACENALYDTDERELYFFDKNLDQFRCEIIRRNLGVIGETYAFSETEREIFPILFRYMNSFWWEHIDMIKHIKDDEQKIDLLFSWLEHQMTRNDVNLPSAL